MKPKTIALMVVAVTCGLGASYMTSKLLAERTSEDVETVEVLVVKKSLNTGDPIKNPQDFFEFKKVAKDQEPRDAFVKFEDLKGKVVKSPRRVGDFIFPDSLMSSKDASAFFMENLPPGFRAVGQRVDLQASVSGFANLPLSRVDIIHNVRRGDDASTYAQVLLENVLVLAIDQATQRDESGKAMPGNVVIFALSTEELLKLNVAREMGTLTLALRKFGDTKRSDVDKVTFNDLKNKTKNGESEYGSGELNQEPTPTVAAVPVAPKVEPKIDTTNVKPAIEVAVAAPKDEPKQPDGIAHSLVITEGPNQRSTQYLLDRTTLRVQNQNVEQTPLTPPQPKVEGN